MTESLKRADDSRIWVGLILPPQKLWEAGNSFLRGFGSQSWVTIGKGSSLDGQKWITFILEQIRTKPAPDVYKTSACGLVL